MSEHHRKHSWECEHESKFMSRDGWRCPDCGKWLGMPEPAAPSERAILWDAAKQIPLARDMTMRERFAMAAMQGLIGIPAYKDAPSDRIAAWAVEYADALLAALEAK